MLKTDNAFSAMGDITVGPGQASLAAVAAAIITAPRTITVGAGQESPGLAEAVAYLQTVTLAAAVTVQVPVDELGRRCAAHVRARGRTLAGD
jgi:hypothetical protein